MTMRYSRRGGEVGAAAGEVSKHVYSFPTGAA